MQSQRVGRDCFAEFVLSGAEGLGMTVRSTERPPQPGTRVYLVIAVFAAKMATRLGSTRPLSRRGILGAFFWR